MAEGIPGERRTTIAFFPFLLGITPLLRLYAVNSDRLSLRYTAVPFAITLAFLALLFAFVRAFLKDTVKAGLLVVFVAWLFFNYGRVRTLLHGLDHRLLWPGFAIALGLAFWGVYRMKRDVQGWTAPLNFFSVVLALITLFPVTRALGHTAVQRPPVKLTLPTEPPDIYYIILDAYGRDDELRKHFRFDNSEFLRKLETRGFVIPSNARSNYLYTVLSLPSSLNFDYLNALHPTPITNTAPLVELIERNRVVRSLKAVGYRYVNLPSGLSFTNQSAIADVNYGSPIVLQEFNSLVGQTTMLAPWFKEETEQVSPAHLKMLQQTLLETTSLAGPKFVFAHFLSPHPPYQFRADGSPARHAPSGVNLNWSDKEGYTQQVQYLNDYILWAVDTIVAKSKTPPVIILQSDHGPALRDDTPTQNSVEPWTPTNFQVRSGILNAYLLPKLFRRKIPDDATPVNSFRIVFRELFHADLPNLRNETWYSNRNDLFRLSPVPQEALPMRPSRTFARQRD
ncbi:MAG: hypothetical protein EOP84_00200 [Verrucomicrobiaceae bacterium]|nr:MAG: hypothetical protein EOP84_00200 [Verrucomicrobiaceae bacterium]